MIYLYLFGSYIRGEFDEFSDVDFLVIKDNKTTQHFDISKFSVYTPERIVELYKEGNPFAWHLHLESKLVFSTNNEDFLRSIGKPHDYINLKQDLNKFEDLFQSSAKSISSDSSSQLFDLGMIFLAIRNFATCFSLGHLEKKNFSRDSSLLLDDMSLNISKRNYNLMKSCRILSTRGIGDGISSKEISKFVDEIPSIEMWFQKLKKEANV